MHSESQDPNFSGMLVPDPDPYKINTNPRHWIKKFSILQYCMNTEEDTQACCYISEQDLFSYKMYVFQRGLLIRIKQDGCEVLGFTSRTKFTAAFETGYF